MKKRKVLLSTLAAAVFATSAGALVACGDGVELPNGLGTGTIEVTFNANGGLFKDGTTNKKVTVENGKVSAQPEVPELNGSTFTGYFLEQDGDGKTKITYGANGFEFKGSITVYAHWKQNSNPDPDPDPDPDPVTEEYDITFDGGLYGTIDGAKTKVIRTTNQKVAFPNVSYDTEKYELTGWTDASGKAVYESMPFDGATTVTAQYTQNQVNPDPNPDPDPDPDPEPDPDALALKLLANGTSKGYFTSYDQYLPNENDDRDHDYGITGVELSEDDVITFTLDGASVSFWTDMYSPTVSKLVSYESGTVLTSVTVKANGTYDFYLKHYPNDGATWVLDVQGEPEGGGGEDDPEELTLEVFANGTSKGTLTSYDQYLPNENDDRDHDYGITGVELSKDDVITFKLDGASVSFWTDMYSPTVSKLVSYESGTVLTSVTVKANGTYDFYLKHYPNDGATWVLDVQGKPEGGGEEPGPGPNEDDEELDIQILAGGTSKGSLDSYDAWLGDKEDGRKHDYGKTGFSLSKNDVITITVDGTAIEFFIDGVDKEDTLALVTAANPNAKNTSVTVKANGTYDFYLKEYATGWVLQVKGTAEGGGEEPGPVDPPQPGESVYYLYGKVGGEDKYSTATGYLFEQISPDADETNVTKKYKLVVALSEGDKVKIFKTEAADDTEAWNYNHYEKAWDYAKYENNNLQILQTGTFTFYFKLYSDGGDSVWVSFKSSGEEPGPVTPGPDDPVTKADGIYIGENKVAALEINKGNQNTGCTEYWFGGDSVKFTQGDKLTIYIGGKKLTNIYGLQGVTGDASDSNSPNTVLTITATGKYKVYLKLWKDSGNYTVEFAKDADVGNVSDLPNESCRVVVTGSDNKTITLYLVDANGDPLTIGNYKMWAWGAAGDLLADKWDNRPTVTAEMTAPKALGDKISFKFTKGSSETNNLEGIATGKTYVVTINGNTISIKEYTGA